MHAYALFYAGWQKDDDWADGFPTEEDTHAVADMGLTKEEIAKQVAGWRANQAAAQARILSAKAYNWQLLNCVRC